MHLSLENLRNPSVCATGGGVRIAPWSRRAYGWVVNDDVIDLTRYLARTPPDSEQEGARGNFSVWGGEGERSRFALPIWRSIYLVGGGRGGGGQCSKEKTRCRSPSSCWTSLQSLRGPSSSCPKCVAISVVRCLS